jgi:two-component system capsular synthesis sensor histidine kinase RcsC
MTPRARVLVVDDHPSVRDVWCDVLCLLGYDVMAAGDGAAGLALCDATPFDLVLTDLMRPGLSGWQLAEAIRTRSATPIVLITGLGAEEHIERARGQAMVLIQKPVYMADLKRAVEEALQSRHSLVS